MNLNSVHQESGSYWMIKQPTFWLEILIMLIVPLPDSQFMNKILYLGVVNWVDDDKPAGSYVYQVPYLTNDFFLAAMFVRFFFVLQTMVILSPPNNRLMGKRVCNQMGVQTDFWFQLKTAFRERPYTFFIISFSFFTLTLAFLIRIFERPYYEFNFPDTDYH